MKKSLLITIFALAVVFSGFAQNDLKGPAYKNAKASEKFEGNTSVLMKVNPRQFQGPAYKNLKKSNYEIEIIDSKKTIDLQDDLIVSTKNNIYVSDKGVEKIIFKRVRTADMKGKNAKGLKGPAYKNYKPGQ
ncbi:MAG: hypothetical protein KI790_13295 [Cyclobacteriaceae bacterium]|nr:hypothetical protein [Cyclobacteriaceae bacterium HetDA_MAG_MS6]